MEEELKLDEKTEFEIALVQRMQRGLSTTQDAFYVAQALQDRRKYEHLSTH
jgi:hypothetical protein